jgi:subtilisin family serine protease
MLRIDRIHLICLALCPFVLNCEKDDPLEGPIGGIVLVIRSFPAAAKDRELQRIARVEMTINRVEVDHAPVPGAPARRTTIDTQQRRIVIENGDAEFMVGQLAAPVGFISRLRVYPTAVSLRLSNGETVALEVPSPNIPSWEQSGWKFEPVDEMPWRIVENELTGVRGLFRFEQRMLHNKGLEYKFKPTIPAEGFAINPPAGQPGVLADRLFVVFKPGTSAARIAEIHAGVRATVEFSPELGTGYRIKLPVTVNLQDGLRYYQERSEVIGAHPGVNLALDQAPSLIPTEGFRFEHGTLPAAWKILSDANNGKVGSHQVRVGIIDDGFFLDHDDLRRNIAINQGELPAALFDRNGDGKVTREDILQFDTDDDGVLTFRDLNDARLAAVAPKDKDGDGLIEPTDLLADARYVNAINEDGGKLDDLVGWDFTRGNNNPFAGVLHHGSKVALAIGAEPNNGKYGDIHKGAVGASWRVSIVPLVAGVILGPGMMEAAVFEAIRYAELQKLDIVVIPAGVAVWRKGTGLTCAKKNTPTFSNDPIPADQYDKFVGETIPAMWGTLFNDSQTGDRRNQALYVMSAGNDTADIGLSGIFRFPTEVIKSVIPDGVIVTGGYGDNFDSAINSNYSQKGGTVDLFGPNFWRLTDDELVLGGTSAAAATVGGVAALTLARFPGLTGKPAQLRSHLIATGIDDVDVVGLEFLPPCGFLITGHRRVHALGAVSTVPAM